MRRLLAGALVTVTALSFVEPTAGAATTVAARWRIQATPNPAGASLSSLSGVSCTSASACGAVGYYSDGLSSPEHALADRAAGSTWALQPAVHPAGASGSGLTAVSCTSSSACTAVGSYVKGSGGTGHTFAEAWNGKSWRLETIPRPANATGDELLGISCVSAKSCTAVGSYSDRAGNWALAESWGGTAWVVKATPRPKGAVYTSFEGVSCTSPQACTAVGYYSTSGNGRTFAERWNGSSWVLETVPMPKGATHGELFGVSCSSRSACTAVGSYGDSAGAEVPLGNSWNGTTWAVDSLPSPSGTVESELASVSCTSATACTAVGYYSTGNLKPPLALAETKRPPLEPSNPCTTVRRDRRPMFGVSCTAVTACAAVGYYQNSKGVFTLAEHYS